MCRTDLTDPTDILYCLATEYTRQVQYLWRRNALSSLAPGRLLRYERAYRRRGKGGWLLVRIVRTSRPNGPDCVSERLGRGASLWVAPLKIKRKL